MHLQRGTLGGCHADPVQRFVLALLLMGSGLLRSEDLPVANRLQLSL